MKIYYKDNPLKSVIELTEVEITQLKYKIKIEELEELLFDAHFSLEDGKRFDLDRAKRAVDYTYYSPDDGENEMDKRVNQLLEYYLSELKSDHAGDCTCLCASCSKCFVENMLGINTIKGLGKHGGNSLMACFKTYETVHEVLEYLRNKKIEVTEDWHKPHIDKWEQDRLNLIDWLEKYKTKVGTMEEVQMKSY